MQKHSWSLTLGGDLRSWRTRQECWQEKNNSFCRQTKGSETKAAKSVRIKAVSPSKTNGFGVENVFAVMYRHVKSRRSWRPWPEQGILWSPAVVALWKINLQPSECKMFRAKLQQTIPAFRNEIRKAVDCHLLFATHKFAGKMWTATTVQDSWSNRVVLCRANDKTEKQVSLSIGSVCKTLWSDWSSTQVTSDEHPSNSEQVTVRLWLLVRSCKSSFMTAPSGESHVAQSRQVWLISRLASDTPD